MEAKPKLNIKPIPEYFKANEAQRDLHRQIYFNRDREIRLRDKEIQDEQNRG